MNLAALEIPDSSSEQASWLEQHLLGPDLLDVVALLEAFHTHAANSPTLADICGGHLTAVLNQGLKVLSEDQLRGLLRHSRRLIELQQLILVNGGDYWNSLDVATDRQTTARNWQRLQAALPTDLQQLQAARLPPVTAVMRNSPTWALAAVAATIAVAIGVVLIQPWKSTQWGWDVPGVLAVNVPADKYLEQLADRANDYFQRPRTTATELKQTVREFRHSCDTLIQAGHPQLAQADREWLRERCGAWAKKLDGQLAELERTDDVAKVRTQADATIRTLIEKLRERAEQVGHA